jgi:pimeloyl-ACP methyl ester carboxylesterase
MQRWRPHPIELATLTSAAVESNPVRPPLPRVYSHHIWPSLLAPDSASTKSSPASASAEWEKCIGHRKIACPLLVLWGARAPMGRIYDILSIWKERAERASGRSLPAGHNLQEEAPDQVLAELQAFLK